MNNYKQKCIQGAASSAKYKYKLRKMKWKQSDGTGRVVRLLGFLGMEKKAFLGL